MGKASGKRQRVRDSPSPTRAASPSDDDDDADPAQTMIVEKAAKRRKVAEKMEERVEKVEATAAPGEVTAAPAGDGAAGGRIDLTSEAVAVIVKETARAATPERVSRATTTLASCKLWALQQFGTVCV